ncbi:MAG: DMT family transporter [Acidobacteria bacterium]|nr:DMT family transporter [Acidobacteriota bacterium]
MARRTAPSHTLSRLAVIGSAVLFSTGGAAIKACHLSGWQVASFRSGVAMAAVLLMVPEARRRWTRGTWLVGLAYAGTMVLFVLANKLTTAANTIFLQDTAPLYVLLLSPFLLGERARSRDLFFMLVMAAGMVFFFVGVPPQAATAPRPMAGNILALAAGVCWALTIMGLRHQSRGKEGAGIAAAAVACGNLIAFAVILPMALPVSSASAADWALIVFLGVVQIGLAYVLLTRGVRGVPALEASLLLLVEPVLNPVWAWLVQGENPGLWSLLGGAVILGATAARTVASSHE